MNVLSSPPTQRQGDYLPVYLSAGRGHSPHLPQAADTKQDIRKLFGMTSKTSSRTPERLSADQ